MRRSILQPADQAPRVGGPPTRRSPAPVDVTVGDRTNLVGPTFWWRTRR